MRNRIKAGSELRSILACKRLALASALVFFFPAHPADAVMAGANPDTPSARIDANTIASPWSSVGSVIVSGTVYSGVVIAPRYVLTAAHVVGTTSPAAIQFVLNFGGSPSHTIPAQSVTRYPSYSFPYDDLAIIELTAPVPDGIAICTLARESITSAQPVTIVGYGASGNGNVGASVASSPTVKRVGQNKLDAVQTALDASGRASLFYLFDFDGPTGAGSFGGGTLGNAIETGLAGGDSGSAMFIGAAGCRLAGINTFVSSAVAGQPIDYRFGTIGGGMLLTRPEFLAWIDVTTGYSVPGAEVDIPTLPEWAMIVGIIMLAVVGLRSRVRHAAAQ